jgi:hypothetical protein
MVMAATLVEIGSGGISPIITINLNRFHYGVGIVCNILTPGSSYTVQLTGDPAPSQTGNWVNHDTLVNLTANATGNLGFPVTGLRLQGSGTVAMAVIQADAMRVLVKPASNEQGEQ